MQTSMQVLFCLLLSFQLTAQIDFCKYFKLEIKEYEFDGKKSVGGGPKVFKKDDKLGGFIKAHDIRFEYLLFKNFNLFQNSFSDFPDSNKIDQDFCKNVLQDSIVLVNLTNLCPKKISNWKSSPQVFNLNELTMVASKFFYCDEISESDTSIQYHICIGINGVNDLPKDKDFTLLEAFSIEAIMYYLSKKNEPKFFKEFDDYHSFVSLENRKNFTNFIDMLSNVRNSCYSFMEQNEDLSAKLLRYYSQNRDNFNFILLP